MGIYGILTRGVSKIFGRSAGKLIGSKSGIKVYKKALENGNTVISSYKGGKLFKTITKMPYTETRNPNGLFVPFKRTGHKTVIQNHSSGITTYIDNSDVKYFGGFTQYNAHFNPNTVRKEFKVWHDTGEGGKPIGLAYNRVATKDGSFVAESRAKYDGTSHTPYIQRSEWKAGIGTSYPETDLWISTNNYKMPNGQTTTGLSGRKTYIDAMTDQTKTRSLLGRAHKIAIESNADGTVRISRGQNIM